MDRSSYFRCVIPNLCFGTPTWLARERIFLTMPCSHTLVPRSETCDVTLELGIAFAGWIFCWGACFFRFYVVLDESPELCSHLRIRCCLFPYIRWWDARRAVHYDCISSAKEWHANGIDYIWWCRGLSSKGSCPSPVYGDRGWPAGYECTGKGASFASKSLFERWMFTFRKLEKRLTILEREISGLSRLSGLDAHWSLLGRSSWR